MKKLYRWFLRKKFDLDHPCWFNSYHDSECYLGYYIQGNKTKNNMTIEFNLYREFPIALPINNRDLYQYFRDQDYEQWKQGK